jgi:thiol:disulfide interchange protein DsbD
LVVFFFALPLSAEEPKKFKAPPANPALKSDHAGAAELNWLVDLAPALTAGKKSNQLVFIDFTGVTCTNCKINEKNVFPLADVKAALGKLTRVSLYCDTVPADLYKQDLELEKREDDADVNKKFQKLVFKTEQLPLYAIVKPLEGGEFEVVAVYKEGKINDAKAFLEFLNSKVK